MKILIVEDDLEISKLLADFLQGNGYEVLCQYDGLHVLDCIQEHQIDLILLDIMLPYRSGDTILADIRKFSTVPVIVISAKETTQNKIDLLRLGADDYITKPFDMEEVLARIESNLRRIQFQNSTPSSLKCNDLKYPDKIFSKANLFQSVWNTEYISEDNTLNVHISNLRNKMKAICPDKEFIDTVWGIGYRLHKAEG